eukprot:g40887.t1
MPLEKEFLECIRDGFLDKYVKEPTREQAILDGILCNEKVIIANLAVRDPLGKSDHNMIELFIRMESEVVDSETRVLNLYKGNYEDMSDRVPLILTYHSTSIHIQKIIRRHFHHFQQDATTRYIFPSPPLSAFRRD